MDERLPHPPWGWQDRCLRTLQTAAASPSHASEEEGSSEDQRLGHWRGARGKRTGRREEQRERSRSIVWPLLGAAGGPLWSDAESRSGQITAKP